MTIQFSTARRIARADVSESTVGASPIIRFYTGAKPANCGSASSGTLIAEGTLPSDWMSAAGAAGNVVTKTKAGTWTLTGLPAAGAGANAGYYRIFDSGDTTCHEQGSVTVTGGGGDMTVDNVSVADGQVVTVTGYTITEGNA